MRHFFWLLYAMLIFYPAFSQKSPQINKIQQKKIDSIRQNYQKATTDTSRVNALSALANEYYGLYDFKNATLYNEYTILLSEKLKSSTDKSVMRVGLKNEAAYFELRGDVHQKQSDFRKAIKDYSRALELYNALGIQSEIGVLLSNISTSYSGIGNYSESLKYSFKALKIQEALKNEENIAIELNNIGAIYNDIHEYAKALQYNKRAMDMSLELGDKRLTALYTGNVGHCYQVLGDSAFDAGNNKLSLELTEKAFEYYFKALRMSEENSDRDNAAVCFENIGIVYSNNREYKKALPYLLKALEIYKEFGLTAEQSFCLNMTGIAYQGLGQNKKAEELFKEALVQAKKTRSHYYLMEANHGLSEFYGKTNRPALALKYYKDHIAYRDSIYNRENTNAFARTELNYEFDKKQAEIKFKNDAVIYQLEADNKLNKQLRFFLILIIVFALGLLVFARRAYVNKKKFADFMTSERDRKEILLQEVHHRINNNLQIISSLLSLQANSADDERLYEYLKQSQNRIQSLAVLHDLLYQSDAPLQVNMKEYLDKVMDYHREILNAKSVAVDMDIADVNFNTKMAVPIALVINELVTNSTKYAFEDTGAGKIRVALKALDEKDKWMLHISDTGKGISEDKPVRKGSLGLRLITIMSKQINATLTKSNSPGATFEIVFSVMP